MAGYGWPLVVPDQTALHLPTQPPQAQQQQAALESPAPVQQVVVPPPAPEPKPVAETPPSWQEQALRAQSLLTRASVEVGLESQGNLDLVAFQIAQAIGPAVRLPNLQAQGFKFMRAQLLRFDGKPLAQMLYLGGDKAPLALYAMRGGGKTRPIFKREAGIGAVSWKTDGIAYLLAGEEDEATLLRLAEKIKHEPARPSQCRHQGQTLSRGCRKVPRPIQWSPGRMRRSRGHPPSPWPMPHPNKRRRGETERQRARRAVGE